MKIALAGTGAFGTKHLEALRRIPDLRVEILLGTDAEKTRLMAAHYGIPHAETDLQAALQNPEIEAVILCTPTPLHARQTLACLQAGKHVMVEIPAADCLQDVEAIAREARQRQKVAMVGHTRRFNPGHQWLHQRIRAGQFRLQHLMVETLFLRRSNTNALGQPRSWTDQLLWHHAAHTIDLFQYQTGSPLARSHALQGPIHPELGIALDLSIQLQAANGALCTLGLSFNNNGPLGSTFRYIGDTNTYLARYDDLQDGHGQRIDLSQVALTSDGIELQDREFLAAIREQREPCASIHQLLPCYQALHDLEQQLASN